MKYIRDLLVLAVAATRRSSANCGIGSTKRGVYFFLLGRA